MTVKEAFTDYQDKMGKLSNILYAQSEYLKQLAGHCQEVADECDNVAYHLRQVVDGALLH